MKTLNASCLKCCGHSAAPVCAPNCDACVGPVQAVTAAFGGFPSYTIPMHYVGACQWGGSEIVGEFTNVISMVCVSGCWVITIIFLNFDQYTSGPVGCGDACPPLGTFAMRAEPGQGDFGPTTVTLS